MGRIEEVAERLEGLAEDALAVGDRLRDLESELRDLDDEVEAIGGSARDRMREPLDEASRETREAAAAMDDLRTAIRRYIESLLGGKTASSSLRARGSSATGSQREPAPSVPVKPAPNVSTHTIPRIRPEPPALRTLIGGGKRLGTAVKRLGTALERVGEPTDAQKGLYQVIGLGCGAVTFVSLIGIAGPQTALIAGYTVRTAVGKGLGAVTDELGHLKELRALGTAARDRIRRIKHQNRKINEHALWGWR